MDRLRAGQPGFDSQQGQQIFLYSAVSRLALGPTEPIQLLPGALSPGVKQPGHVDEHSPPSSAEVENVGAIPPLPIRLHGTGGSPVIRRESMRYLT
jgi:hypothetical protein